MRDEAERRIGHLYPKATLPKERAAARRRSSPGSGPAPSPARTRPAAPRCRSCARCARQEEGQGGLGRADRRPARAKRSASRSATGRSGRPTRGRRTVGRQGARASCCGAARVRLTTSRPKAKRGRMGAQLMAIVAEGNRGRIYLAPTDAQHEAPQTVAVRAKCPTRSSRTTLERSGVASYGMTDISPTSSRQRQLVALTTFSDLVGEARERVLGDASRRVFGDDRLGSRVALAPRHMPTPSRPTSAFASSKLTDIIRTSALGTPSPKAEFGDTFARQALPMTWDFAEANPSAGPRAIFVDAVELRRRELSTAAPATGRPRAEQRTPQLHRRSSTGASSRQTRRTTTTSATRTSPTSSTCGCAARLRCCLPGAV